MRAAIPALLSGLLLLAVPAAAADDPSLFDEGRAQAALEQIFERAKHPTRILSLDIEAHRLVVEVQDPTEPKHVDAWTDQIATGRMAWLVGERIAGPEPVALNLINPSLDENLFAFTPADAAAVRPLIAAAIKRAGLEDPPTEARLTLKRSLHLVPQPSSGPPEWEVAISSGRERATIFADIGGRITHANFDGTRRAQALNYLAGGQDFDDAVAMIVDVIGKEKVVRTLNVDPHRIGFEAPNPDHPDRTSRYWAGLNGVYRDLLTEGMANIAIPNHPPPGRFSVSEIDWTLLTKLQDAARRQLDLPGGRVTGVHLARPDTGAGDSGVEWEIGVVSTSDPQADGRVVFDAGGKVLHTKYPPGKAPKLDLFEVAAFAAAFETLSRSLGEHALVTELRFDSDKLLVSVKDPKGKDPLAQVVFEYRGEALSRSVLSALDWPTFGPDWFFDLAAAGSAAKGWAALQQDTLARLGMSGAHIDRITISKQKLMMPRNDRVLIEIRAEEGRRGGRVVYDLSGKPVDIVRP